MKENKFHCHCPSTFVVLGKFLCGWTAPFLNFYHNVPRLDKALQQLRCVLTHEAVASAFLYSPHTSYVFWPIVWHCYVTGTCALQTNAGSLPVGDHSQARTIADSTKEEDTHLLYIQLHGMRCTRYAKYSSVRETKAERNSSGLTSWHYCTQRMEQIYCLNL